MAMTVDGCIQFTRHAGDVLLNFHRLRSRNLLTDVTVQVDGQLFHAHRAILVACSGFFYSVFMKPENANLSAISLDPKVDPEGFALLLDFMYTSCLNLNDSLVMATLNTAIYLEMEHVAETCHRFIKSRHQSLNMHVKEVQTKSASLAEEISALRPAGAKEPESKHNSSSSVSPIQECRAFTPNVFRGINTSGSYHVYGDLCASAGKQDGSYKVRSFPSMALIESSTTISHSVPSHSSFPSAIRRSPVAHGSFQSPAAPMEEDNFNHPQASCLRLSPGYSKGVICSPQSPLRSDCQPNSPTESSSSINAGAGHKQPTDTGCKDTRPHNWKKYKFIVMNPSPCENAKEEQAGSVGAPSPSSLSPCGSGASDALQTEDEAGGHKEEAPEPQSLHTCCSISPQRCSSCSCESPQGSEGDQHSPDSYSSENNYLCNGCDSKFMEEDSLKEHMAQVHSDKPYKCDCCQAAFRYKGNLASHKTVHTGAKPYHCNICGAQFNRPANLKTHTRIHSGEKPYKCETCGSRFVQVAHLRAHVLIHTGEKPYPCEICGTHFRHLQTLKSHMRIHTGEKPYHCEKCDLHFRHKSQLRLHLRQKHGAVTNTKAQYRRSPSNMVTGQVNAC